LVGDAADGLPGLSGWGAKSSSILLERYRHLEEIPLDASRWDIQVRSAEKLATTLRANMGDALLFRFLAQLRFDVPLQESLADLEWEGAPRDRWLAFCDEFGFDRLRDRPRKWDVS
jgi:5'-3' exonuclease